MNLDKESKTASNMPPQVVALYQAKTDQLTFLKKQQWAITNYLLLLIAAIFGVDQALRFVCLEKVVLTGFIPTACVLELLLLFKINNDIKDARNSIQKITIKWFSAAQRKQYGLPERYEPQPSERFVLGLLIGVSIAGTLLVLWSFWRAGRT
ncbi:MAG: hypothetical protein HYW28_02115 [Rhodospirillales bacterium]|nr:hypothetical protein [Rhodospirillales bacterium]